MSRGRASIAMGAIGAAAILLGTRAVRAQDAGAAEAPAPEVPAPAPPPPAPAPAPEAPVVAETVVEGSTGAPPERLETTVNGYLDTRFTWQRINPGAGVLLPADDVPRLANLTEANVQLKLRWGSSAFVLGDASFFFQRAWLYPGTDHDVPAYRPLAVISELYGSYSLTEHANVTIGKKRVVWGPGFLLNPMDLLNPPKDPTDPSLQRAGAWLARLELPFQRFTVSLVGAAKAFGEYGGVPSHLLYDPSYDPAADGQAHLAAARVYALVADSDINVEYVHQPLQRRLPEEEPRRPLVLAPGRQGPGGARRGAGAARLVALLRRSDLRRRCGRGGRVRGCTPPAARSKLDDRTAVVHGIAGARYTFDDDSLLGADYALYSDGYSDDEWRAFLRGGLALARESGVSLPALGFPGPGAGGDTAGGTPQKLVFEPLRRQYLFVSYSKPRIRDDFTFNVTLIASLQDLSGQLVPQLVWQAAEWLNVTAQAFVPIPAAHPTEIDGVRYSEYGLAPADYRALLAARVFY